jgi:ring-1,2-phenylacetyl-CoA epoxidase subunit PaaD
VVSAAPALALDEARRRVAAVPDPELPMLSIADLGILRRVEESTAGFRVVLTPTYSGCPAVDAIRNDVTLALAPALVEVVIELAPAWSTDDITEAGRAALAAHGIAPPSPAGTVALTLSPRCPHCGSGRTRELSRFGSTSCKALWVCAACAEPFESFKDHR